MLEVILSLPSTLRPATPTPGWAEQAGHLLRTVLQMDEADETSAAPSAIQTRLEAKLDLTLQLLADWKRQISPPPEPAPLTLSANLIMGQGACRSAAGSTMALDLFVDARAPLPLTLFGQLSAAGPAGWALQLGAFPDELEHAWNQFLFRHHRAWLRNTRGNPSV